VADTPGGGGSFLTQKYGPLVGWQWIAIIGGGGGLFLYYRQKKAAAAAQSATDTSTCDPTQDPTCGTGPIPGIGGLQPIIVQQGPPSTTPANPANALSYVTNTSKVSGPSRNFNPVSGPALADFLLKNGLITGNAASGYKTTKKFGGPVRNFDVNAAVNTNLATLVKEGIVIPVANRSTTVAPVGT
jgi:hypothetical protein